MKVDVTITRTDSTSHATYTGRVPGLDAVAELTLSKASATLVIADHTDVPDQMRGMGVGAALAARLVADARAGGYRIIPLCPFVRSQYARHPEWADVMQA
jgi:uncharacterized protein